MDKIIISPAKYIQGPGVISRTAQYTANFGHKVFAIADTFVLGMVRDALESSYYAQDAQLTLATFNGECSRPEIARLQALAEQADADLIVGIGGGKTLDTAKAMAFFMKKPVVVVPTIASTDAPTSALAVIYTEQHEFSDYLMIPSNPNMVLMDTEIIARAPARLLVSGMGDALSTYFEARANARSGKATMAGGIPTLAAQTLARLCFDTLMANGVQAKIAAEQGLSSLAVENIIEANTYLSGIGFESSGLAAAHAIHNGLTKLVECHHLLHGEKVAFGTLTQLVLENAPLAEIKEIIQFCRDVGLPTNLTQMGVTDVSRETLQPVAEASCAPGETIHNMPFPVTPELVLSALISAHQLGSL